MIRCTNCQAPLAHDQRYCVECGARRGPLPESVAAMIAGILEQGRNDVPASVGPAEPAAAPVGAGAGARPPRPATGWIPSPRVAALVVMAMLAFGAELGSIVGASNVATLASAPLLVFKQSPPQVVTTIAAAANTGSSSGGGGGSASPAPAAPAATTPAPAVAAATTPTTPTTTTATTPAAPSNPYGLPPINHVFVIMLGPAGYSQTFGSQDPYLSKTLPKQGRLVQFYYGVNGGELANQIALVSGQGPTQETQANCPTFANVTPGNAGKHHQVLGSGCVYPKSTNTLGGQMTAAHLTWKAYIQGMANGTPGQPQACRHPTLGSADSNQAPQNGDTYVTWRNPFVYFHSVIDSKKTCGHLDVDLSQLSTDLTNESTTPNLSYIVANPCDDGNDQPCAVGGTSGVAAADSFLRLVVPEIENSAAYQAGGLIMITFDQAPQTGQYADQSACCATPAYPNLAGAPPVSTTTPTTTTPTTTAPVTTTPTTTAPAATTTTTTAPATTTSTSTTPTTPTTTTPTTTAPVTTTPTAATPTTTTTTSTTPNLGQAQGQTTPTGGGGQVGLLLISKWVKAGTLDPIDYYNHYALLASIEDIFNLKHLGYANQTGLAALDAGTFDGKGPAGG